VCKEFGRFSLEKLKARRVSQAIGLIIAALLVGLFYGTVSTRKIVGTIKSFLNGVSSAAEQTASLEESSSSLEEISSMVKQNAGHAEEAEGMIAEATEVSSKDGYVRSHG
jgi:methyl-accepting chemotaxis protein